MKNFFSIIILTSIFLISLIFTSESIVAKTTNEDYLKTEIASYNLLIKPKPKFLQNSNREFSNINDTDGKPIYCNLYELIFDENRLYLVGNEIIWNMNSYGILKKNDNIKIENNDFYINEKLIIGKKIDKDFRIAISSPHNFSSTKFGSYTVKIAPGSSICFNEVEEIDGNIFYYYKVGNTVVEIKKDTLYVDGEDYGLLKENAIVIVEEKKVYIEN